LADILPNREKILAHCTDTLITTNKEDYDLAKNKFKTDVRYVPGVGIDPKKFDISMTQQQKTDLRKSLGLKDSDFVMIYPAELNKNKNQKMLIDVMEIISKTHNNIHLLLPGKDNMNGYHQKIAKEKNLNNIHFLGYRNDIPQLMKISNLAVSTSLREGLPVNIMEAMYVGLPIIATNCRGNRDLIKNGLNGYILESNDQNGLANKVAYLEKRIDARDRMARNNNKLISNYLLAKILTSMHGIYAVGDYNE